WAACERFEMGGEGEESGALVGGQATHAAQGWLVAVRTSQDLGGSGLDGRRRDGGSEQQLQTAQGVALARVQQSEGANAVQATQRDVLEEAAQKLVGRQAHGLAHA